MSSKMKKMQVSLEIDMEDTFITDIQIHMARFIVQNMKGKNEEICKIEEMLNSTDRDLNVLGLELLSKIIDIPQNAELIFERKTLPDNI